MKANRQANNMCVVQIPEIVANCAPLSAVEDLNTAFSLVIAVREAHRAFDAKAAAYTSILVVPTVVRAPAVVVTADKVLVVIPAIDIVHPNGALPAAPLTNSLECVCEAESLAHNIGVVQVPAIIAYCAPLPVVEDLHAALPRPAPVGKAYRAILGEHRPEIKAIGKLFLASFA